MGTTSDSVARSEESTPTAEASPDRPERAPSPRSRQAAAGVKRRISAAIGFPDFEAFTTARDEARKRVRAAFAAIVGR